MDELVGSTVRERKTLSPSWGGSVPDGPETTYAAYGALQGSTVTVGRAWVWEVSLELAMM